MSMRDLVLTVEARQVTVRSEFIGFHRWADAPPPVDFLRDFHRHVFKVQVVIDVPHGDRAVEFFTVQTTLDSVLRANFAHKRFELSCEDVAEEIGHRMAANGYRVRAVEVNEDGENAGTVYFTVRERGSGEPQTGQPVKLRHAHDD